MKKILVLLVAGFTLAGCSAVKQTGDKSLVKLSGKIEKLGMSTFQYGTHLLKADAKTYALKSSKVNLDLYVDKQVTIKGEKVAGYPIENGPDFIDVVEIASF